MMTGKPVLNLGRTRSRIYQAALRLFAQNGGSEIAVTDLADAAGIARGTIYNNIDTPETLLGDVARAISTDMLARTEAAMSAIADPVERLATGVRLFVRRAHDDPDWGRFVVRFALGEGVLHNLMREPPARDVAAAIAAGRFALGEDQVPAYLAMLSGTTLTAMNAVLRGDQTWKEAGGNAAELLLRAAGIAPDAALRLARVALPELEPSQAKTRHRPRRTG